MSSFNEATRTVGRKRVIEHHPYTGVGVDALGAQITAILKGIPEAQRIVLDATKQYIHLERFVKGEPDKAEEQARYDFLLGNIPMHEYVPEKKLPPYEFVFNMFRQVTDEGLEVVLALSGNLVTLDKWIPLSKKLPKLFGVPVRRLKNVPEDLLIICGAEWIEPEIEDIKFTVKGAIS
jgi:hypothetical protein